MARAPQSWPGHGCARDPPRPAHGHVPRPRVRARPADRRTRRSHLALPRRRPTGHDACHRAGIDAAAGRGRAGLPAYAARPRDVGRPGAGACWAPPSQSSWPAACSPRLAMPHRGTTTSSLAHTSTTPCPRCGPTRRRSPTSRCLTSCSSRCTTRATCHRTCWRHTVTWCRRRRSGNDLRILDEFGRSQQAIVGGGAETDLDADPGMWPPGRLDRRDHLARPGPDGRVPVDQRQLRRVG